MKILHVNFAKGFRGGERQTELLIRALGRRELQQGLLVRSDSPLIERLADEAGLTILTTRKPYIRKTVSQSDFDFVHAHETKAAQWAYLNYRLRRTPYIITRRVPNPIKKNFFTRAIYHEARTTVCLSQEIRSNLRSSAPQANSAIVADMCAELPVDSDLLQKLRKRYRGRTVIGTAGALVKKHKGQQFLIDAARALQDRTELHFLILGEGRDRHALEQQSKDLPNVELAGFREEIGTYLKLFDMFVFPSLEEGMGSTLLDAMRAGCPIVASNVGGIPEIVADGENGLLVPAADAVALQRAIERILGDATLARRLTRAGTETVKRFSPAAIGAQYLSLYESLFGERATTQSRSC